MITKVGVVPSYTVKGQLSNIIVKARIHLLVYQNNRHWLGVWDFVDFFTVIVAIFFKIFNTILNLEVKLSVKYI